MRVYCVPQCIANIVNRHHRDKNHQTQKAGENIIVEFDDEVWMDDLGAKIGIEDAETGEMAILHMQCHTDPCFEFSNFAMQTTGQKVPATQTKEALQFLAKGRRGFLFVLQPDTDAIVRKGDRVYIVE